MISITIWLLVLLVIFAVIGLAVVVFAFIGILTESIETKEYVKEYEKKRKEKEKSKEKTKDGNE